MINQRFRPSRKVVIFVSAVTFLPYFFTVFDWLFASCYIDDGCGKTDPFVPFIVLGCAMASSFLTGITVGSILKVIKGCFDV